MANNTFKSQASGVEPFCNALIETNDLLLDRIYEGGRSGNSADDRLSKMLGVSNQGGFRYRGSPNALEMIVVTSNFNDPDWPDYVDRETGVFQYFGDNKHPGRDLHDTPRKGNLLLREIFDSIHSTPAKRSTVPPIFVFRNTGNYRDVEFLGLAVPGAENRGSSDDLVAIWRMARGQRFQNYHAIFTILDVPRITRAWISDIQQGTSHSDNAPAVWLEWIRTGKYRALRAVRTLEYRRKAEQLPQTDDHRSMIKLLHGWFAADPYKFEACAEKLIRMMDSHFISFDLTRPSRDGGRDAIGKYRIGDGPGAIAVDCAMEAKCYDMKNAVGVREISRLISRLRHRQFGILVTTSYLHEQAYKEIKEDAHPIVIIAALDIIDILAKHGVMSSRDLRDWLACYFPAS